MSDSLKLFLLDSISVVSAASAGHVVISGSHGGVSAARLALVYPPRLVFLNDAGIGLDEAGVAGLVLLEAAGVAACAVSNLSARIGSAQSTLETGVITRCNEGAVAMGLCAGISVQSWLKLNDLLV
jgi:hypothetical protein